MKLTNISLAILVALGLAACGGSDDNTPQTSDNQEAGHNNQTPTGGNGGNGGNENTPPTTTPPKSGLDPERSAPDLTVPKDLQSDVSARKAIYLSNGFADNALGYPDDGITYKKNEGTDPANVKYLSMYNFAEQGDVIPSDKIPSGLKAHAAGAIYVGQNPASNDLNAFALGKDGLYYRVRAYTPAGYDKNAKFFLTGNALPADELASGIKKYTGGNASLDGVDQDKVFFIANASTDATVITLDLGKDGYDLKKSQVILDGVNVLGKTYNATAKGQQLDLNGLDVKREIQITPVTSSYTILNGKGSAQSTDDVAITKDIDLGHIKAYNLPYSIAFVTIDPSKKHEKDIFATKSPFVIDGLQTVSLPKQGRAFYTGKSFNATVEGDIKLTADFFDDRAGVVGTVTNRQNIVTKQKLPNLRLGRLMLTNASEHRTYAVTDSSKPETVVTGDPKVTGWSVQFYGLEAQEAAGMLTGPNNYQEVYNSQRGKLTNLSNTSDVK